MRIFVTGASGWIGSAVVPELIGAGHRVLGLARSDASAAALERAGAEVQRGDIDDLDVLRGAAAATDGVIHLAFKHDLAFTGQFEAASLADRLAIEAFGDALEGSDKPFAIASGTLGLAPGRVATELDGREPGPSESPLGGAENRMANAYLTLGLASRGIRSAVLRLPPTCHGEGDNGFMTFIIGIAREQGRSGYIGDGANRWPAAHRLDVAKLFRLAVEGAPAGSALQLIADEGVPIRAIAEVIGRHLELPVTSVSPEESGEHFGWMAGLLALDSPASSTITRKVTGWEPTHPGLIEDLELGHYFKA
jgi:nucleoside-diphosphate-sugar epimerase